MLGLAGQLGYQRRGHHRAAQHGLDHQRRAQRLLCHQRLDRAGIARRQAAVRLGLGYPKGPLEFGDTLGARTVLSILDAMYAFYGDPRYRASAWLKRCTSRLPRGLAPYSSESAARVAWTMSTR